VIDTLELEIITRLKGVLGKKVRAVESLPAEWTEELLAKLLRVFPAVYIVFAGGRNLGGSPGVRLDSRWVIYVVTGHAGGAAQRKQGDGREAGAYDLLSRVLTCLNGHSFSSGSMLLENVDTLATARSEQQGVIVYGSTWRLPMMVEADFTEDATTDFDGLDAEYDLVPTDEQLEAQDTINIEQ